MSRRRSRRADRGPGQIRRPPGSPGGFLSGNIVVPADVIDGGAGWNATGLAKRFEHSDAAKRNPEGRRVCAATVAPIALRRIQAASWPKKPPGFAGRLFCCVFSELSRCRERVTTSRPCAAGVSAAAQLVQQGPERRDGSGATAATGGSGGLRFGRGRAEVDLFAHRRTTTRCGLVIVLRRAASCTAVLRREQATTGVGSGAAGANIGTASCRLCSISGCGCRIGRHGDCFRHGWSCGCGVVRRGRRRADLRDRRRLRWLPRPGVGPSSSEIDPTRPSSGPPRRRRPPRRPRRRGRRSPSAG